MTVFVSSADYHQTSSKKFTRDIVWGLILAPIWASISLMIICVMKVMYFDQPVWFTQERIGLNKKPFRILKFRTMESRTGNVTRFCALLRATHLDELPQFWNVLRGDMALVGPRPLIEADCIRLCTNERRFNLRFTMLPGIIGIEQILGRAEQQKRTIACSYVLARQLRTRRGIHKLMLELRYITLTVIVMCYRQGSRT